MVLRPQELTDGGPKGALAELDRMVVEFGLARPRAPRRVVDFLLTLNPDAALLDQLEVMTAMHRDTAALQVRDNFAYLGQRALHVLRAFPPDAFGQRRLLTPFELCEVLLASATRADAGGADEVPLP